MAETAIITRGLTRSFGEISAVKDLDLEVPKGAVYGFLGPNGAGKTTTIRLLLGLLTADSGSAEIFGKVFGKDVTYIQVDVAQAVAAVSEGATENAIATMTEMYEAMKAGKIVPAEPRTAETTTPTTLEQFAREVMLPMAG